MSPQTLVTTREPTWMIQRATWTHSTTAPPATWTPPPWVTWPRNQPPLWPTPSARVPRAGWDPRPATTARLSDPAPRWSRLAWTWYEGRRGFLAQVWCLRDVRRTKVRCSEFSCVLEYGRYWKYVDLAETDRTSFVFSSCFRFFEITFRYLK